MPKQKPHSSSLRKLFSSRSMLVLRGRTFFLMMQLLRKLSCFGDTGLFTHLELIATIGLYPPEGVTYHILPRK